MTPLVKSIYDISVLHEGEPASELQTSVCIKLGELSTQAAETESALATANERVKELEALTGNIDFGDIGRVRKQFQQVAEKLKAIDLAVDGYVDGSPDCNSVSKLANEISTIIHPPQL